MFYTTSSAGQVFRSTNAGSAATCNDITLTDITPPGSFFAFVSPHVMAVQPNNNNRIFLAYHNSVAYSTNGGTNWNSTNFSVSSNGITPAVTSVFADENGTLYIGTQDGGAFICTDAFHYCDGSEGSGAWTPWGLNVGGATQPPRMITAIAESGPPSASRNFWMGSTDGVYRQLAGETTWTLVQSAHGFPGTPNYVYNEVVVDPNCSTRIYAGIGYLESMSRTRGGINYSTDNGAHWASLTSGFDPHQVPITQVVVDPANQYHVIASTYGRGVWDYYWALPGFGGIPLPACQ